MRTLTTDMGDEQSRPYFLWDEQRTIAEFRRHLAAAGATERSYLIGKLMREARDTDVWKFVTPREIWAEYDGIRRHLGRNRRFWDYLLNAWHGDGYLP